jgi:hypothetical protein
MQATGDLYLGNWGFHVNLGVSRSTVLSFAVVLIFLALFEEETRVVLFQEDESFGQRVASAYLRILKGILYFF